MKESIKDLAQRVFFAGDRVGVHILPSHYYSPVASRKTLRQTETYWRRPLDPIPFEWEIADQVDWLRRNTGSFPDELSIAEIYRISESVGGFRYGPIEAQFLYSYIRTNAPRRIIEIGSGSSTLVMSRAVERNVSEGRSATAILALDPYTADRVRGLPHVEARSIGGLMVKASDLDLESGDVLFIDSTHTVRTGSELSHLYLEILPGLNSGVVVHVHDIYFPYVFGPNIYGSMFDWQETTLLAALLANSQQLGVLASMSGVFHADSGSLKAIFPEFVPRAIERGVAMSEDGFFPSATWMQVR